MNIQYVILIVFLSIGLQLDATDYFVMPNGAGDQTGRSWSHAIGQEQMNDVLRDNLSGGDRLLLGGGAYTEALAIHISGKTGAPVVVEGVDRGSGRPEFLGEWTYRDPAKANGSRAAVDISGAANVVVRNLDIRRWKYGVHAGGAAKHGVLLEDLNIVECREGIYLKNVYESRIRNTQIFKYTKRGIRFNGFVNFIELEKVFTDHNLGDTSWPREWPFGFMIEEKDGNHDITYRYCVSKNNIQDRGSDGYWNGDGFVAERTAYNIAYYNCRAFNNADAGFDDKSKAPRMEGCMAFGNKRNFRIWNVDGDENEPALMLNCIGGYAKAHGGIGAADGLWTRGHTRVVNCTFHNNSDHAIESENGGGGHSVVVEDSILSVDRRIINDYDELNLIRKDGGIVIGLQNTKKLVYGHDGISPGYRNDQSNWCGKPADAFDSISFPKLGYSSHAERN